MSPFFLNHAVSPFSFSFFGFLAYYFFSFSLTSSDSVRPGSKNPVLMAREMSACSYRNQSSVSAGSPPIRIVSLSNTHFQKQITSGLFRLLQK